MDRLEETQVLSYISEVVRTYGGRDGCSARHLDCFSAGTQRAAPFVPEHRSSIASVKPQPLLLDDKPQRSTSRTRFGPPQRVAEAGKSQCLVQTVHRDRLFRNDYESFRYDLWRPNRGDRTGTVLLWMPSHQSLTVSVVSKFGCLASSLVCVDGRLNSQDYWSASLPNPRTHVTVGITRQQMHPLLSQSPTLW